MTDPSAYVFIDDLSAAAAPPERGILSVTADDGPDLRLVLFGFAPGEELSEHTAARSAVIHVLAGRGEAVIGGDRHAIATGAWIRMPAGMTHSIRATTALAMALYLLPRAG